MQKDWVRNTKLKLAYMREQGPVTQEGAWRTTMAELRRRAKGGGDEAGEVSGTPHGGLGKWNHSLSRRTRAGDSAISLDSRRPYSFCPHIGKSFNITPT